MCCSNRTSDLGRLQRSQLASNFWQSNFGRTQRNKPLRMLLRKGLVQQYLYHIRKCQGTPLQQHTILLEIVFYFLYCSEIIWRGDIVHISESRSTQLLSLVKRHSRNQNVQNSTIKSLIVVFRMKNLGLKKPVCIHSL